MLAGDSLHSPRMTVGEEADLMAKHAAAVNFADGASGRLPVQRRATATIRGIIARAYYSADHAKLVHFCDVLKTGSSPDEEEPLSCCSGSFWSAMPAPARPAVRRIRYAKAERALMAYLHGERISYLRAVGSELFPLPEDIAQDVAA